MNIHLGVEHALGQRLLQIADQASRIEHRLRVATFEQRVKQFGRERPGVLLRYTSLLALRAVYGSTHKKPDRLPRRTNTNGAISTQQQLWACLDIHDSHASRRWTSWDV